MPNLNNRKEKRENQYYTHNRKAGMAKWWKQFKNRKFRRKVNKTNKNIVDDKER